jgi:glycosyltransferase involved in cell wall biosynthesis
MVAMKEDRGVPELKKILIVALALYNGGAEKIASLLAKGLSERYDVTVAYYMEEDGRYDFGDKCRFVRLPYREGTHGNSLVSQYLAVWRRARALKKLKDEEDFDLSLSLLFVPCVINVLSKAGRGLTLCSERSSPEKAGALVRFLSPWIYRRADFVIFQSEQVRHQFGPEIRSKSRILKNPVEIPPRADEVRRKRIVNIGRLKEQKNQEMLIRSFAEFRKTHPEYTLSIYGEGELREDLERQIDSLGLADCVFLEGNRSDVHERIRDAEMFVLSSRYEGCSNALLECMSRGMACISTRCEGSTDVIRDGENGLLVGLEDEKGLTEAMSRLADDPDLRKRIEEQAFLDLRAWEKTAVMKEWEQTLLDVWRDRYEKRR